MHPILRFAPSPTGKIHVGNVRAALMNFLFAKRHNGKFILRIDDTDVERSKQEYTDQIKEDLLWLGLKWDETFSQSSRILNYNLAIETLHQNGFLYKCYESKEELEIKRKILLSKGKPPVYDRYSLGMSEEDHIKMKEQGVAFYWRFKLDQKRTSWTDLIHGKIEVDTASLSDPIVQKSDGTFVYTLASVVDDVDYGITHIIRGDDHIANTAVQIQLFRAISGKDSCPLFGHYPLLTSVTGDGFSKRDNSMNMEYFRGLSIDPMSLSSLLSKLGTSDQIVPCASMEQLIETFDISKISKASPKFNVDDVLKINQKLLHNSAYQSIKTKVPDVDFSEDFWNLIKADINVIGDIKLWHEVLYGEFVGKCLNHNDADFLQICADTLGKSTGFEDWIDVIKKSSGRSGRELFHPIRLALTGFDSGPELVKLVAFIGNDGVINRLRSAIIK